jgi:hypothetical protein
MVIMNKSNSDEKKLEPAVLRGRFISSLKCYCEKNRREHHEQPAGWGYYVQNLYLSLQQ